TCTVRDGRFLEPCDGIRQCLQGANPTPRDKAGLYLVTYSKAIPFTPTRTFAVLKSGEHSRAGIVVNVCPFCGTRIDEMCQEVKAPRESPGDDLRAVPELYAEVRR